MNDNYSLYLTKKEIILIYELVNENTFKKFQKNCDTEENIMALIKNEINRVAFLNRKS